MNYHFKNCKELVSIRNTFKALKAVEYDDPVKTLNKVRTFSFFSITGSSISKLLNTIFQLCIYKQYVRSTLKIVSDVKFHLAVCLAICNVSYKMCTNFKPFYVVLQSLF